MLRDCAWTKDVWAAAKISFPDFEVLSFKDIFDFVWHNGGRPEAEKLVTISWQIWKSRNDLVFENTKCSPALCFGKAVDWLLEYQKALSVDDSTAKLNREQARWIGPPDGVLKVNSDGACSMDDGRMGLGFVVRDALGRFVMAGLKTLYSLGSAEEAEICALS